MVTPEALAYVRAKQDAGSTKEQISKDLLNVGWDAPTVEEIFNTIEKEKPKEEPKKVAAIPEAQATKTPATSGVGAEALRSRVTVTPTMRALTAIDSQLRAGVDKKTIQALLEGVGWDADAVNEAFLAVDWGESLLKPSATAQSSPDTQAPKLHVVENTLAHTPVTPTRPALVAIDALLKGGASKGNIRTLLMGVGWDLRAIDEAFLAVEWRDEPDAPAQSPEQK